MGGCGKIAMDDGSGDGQRRRNQWQDGGVITMGNGMAVAQSKVQMAVDDCQQFRSGAMGGDTRWMAAAITMKGGSKIAMDGGSGDRQWWSNGQRDRSVIAIGNETAAAQWMAQWAADDCGQCRSGAMGGNARWTAAAITMDRGGMIAMDGGSNDGQWWCNGRQDGKTITMGNGTVVVRWTAQWAGTIAIR
jgi:hypothetical protein